MSPSSKWLATDDVAIALGLRGGWGYGLVVSAGDREVAALGGGWIGAKLAASSHSTNRSALRRMPTGSLLLRR